MNKNSNGVIKKIFLLTFICSMLFMPFVFVSANDFGRGELEKAVGGQYQGKENLGDTIGSMISAVLALAGTIFLILTVYGGITWMTAMGNAEKIEKAKSIITAAIIGGAITGGAYAITFFVMGRISNSPPTAPTAPTAPVTPAT